MKFNQLRSIGHNIADSLASGIGLMIGVYGMNVFAEARRSRDGCITVDFLAGECVGTRPSPSLARAIVLYRHALTDLCRKHGTTPAAFRQMTARYSVEAGQKRFVVVVEDQRGRCATDEYVGIPGTRAKILDSRGRVRRTGRRKFPRSGREGEVVS
jgi:hypothetical protein